MIDLLKQVPEQEEDEGVQLKLQQSVKTTDNALNAFLFATNNLDTNKKNQQNNFSFQNLVDPEIELNQAFNEIEASVSRFAASGKSGQPQGYRNKGSTSLADFGEDDGYSEEDEVRAAAKEVGETTKQLMAAAIEVQHEIKRTEGKDVFKKDPNWALALIDTTKAVSQTTCQLVDLALDSNASPEELIAAARCVIASTSTLVDVSKAKGDPNSRPHQKLEDISRSLAKAANRLVGAAKNQGNAAGSDDFDSIRDAPINAQIKSEFEAQTKIAKLEAELESAREYLDKVRKVLRGVNN